MTLSTGALLLGSAIAGGLSDVIGGKRAAGQIAAGTDQANQATYDAQLYGNERIADATQYTHNRMGDQRAANQRVIDPYRQLGQQGRGELEAGNQFGFPTDRPGMNQNLQNISGNPQEVMGAFYESPDYQYRKEQGMEGIENTFAGGSAGVLSGNALRALNEHNLQLAGSEFGDWWNRQGDIGMTQYNIDSDNYNRQEGASNTMYGRNQDLIGYGQQGDDATIANQNQYYGGQIGNARDAANYYANNATNAGQTYGRNAMNAAGAQAGATQQAYGGVNNAIQSGIGNYMYAQGAGLINPRGGAQADTSGSLYASGTDWNNPGKFSPTGMVSQPGFTFGGPKQGVGVGNFFGGPAQQAQTWGLGQNPTGAGALRPWEKS